MKILFLNPAYAPDFCKSARWFARSRGRVQRHPDYLCQAIAVIEQAGHICKFIDGAAKEIYLEETRKEVAEFQPDIVVIQTTTPSIYSDIGYARMCKEVLGEKCRTVLVGAHVSAEPSDTLEKGKDSVDIVVRGEYDYTLRDIAQGKNLQDILGITYREKGAILQNPARPLIENLEELPFPAWHHIDPHDYRDAGKLYPFITLIGGRGCDGRCAFCLFPQVMYGQRYRVRSAEKVVDEIEYDLELFPYLKEIMFEDDTFTLKKYRDRLTAICNEIIRRKLKITWSANARADIDDIEIFRLMKKSGCRMLVVGYEFGNQEMLNKVRKGTTLEKMRIFTKNCQEVGIRVHGCFMIGGPGETEETALETMKFAQSLEIDTIQFSGLCPYPGTEFYNWCKKNNYLVPSDWDKWVDENLEQRAIVNYPQLSVEAINRLIDRGLRDFYLRPKQVFTILKNLKSWSDFKTKLYGLRSFTDYFNPGKRKK